MANTQQSGALGNVVAEVTKTVMERAGQQGEATPVPGVKPEPSPHEAEQQRARCQFYTIADALKAPKFIPQRIRGILPAKGLSLIYGDPGSLKSMFAFHCAMSVALGRDVLTGVPVRKGRVLILDSDNGIERLKVRLGALARGVAMSGIEDVSDLVYREMHYNGTPISIDTPVGLEALQRAIDDAEAEMVILDSYGGACGAADMNKPEMQRHLLNLRGVAERLGIVVWGIHHSNKTGGMMGTQHFLSTADIPLEVRRPDIMGDLIELSPKKIRDGDVPVRSAMWWRVLTPAVDEFGMEVKYLEQAGFRADPAAAAGRESAEHVAERIALQVVTEYPNGITQQALADSVHEELVTRGMKVGERRIRESILPNMVRRQALRITDGARGAKLYVLGSKAPAGGES
jgi:hypothetical protein